MESDRALYVDPFALTLLGLDDATSLMSLFESGGTPELASVCAYFALRHRIAEDKMRVAIEAGVRDVVVLGAGLDSFALQHPDVVAQINFYEVDHPDTQAWKLRRLEELGLGTPDVRYVAVDFDRESIGERLHAHGLAPDTTRFFTWLGISQYVSAHAADTTFELVASSGPFSEIVFDVILPDDVLGTDDRRLNEHMSAVSARRGEPWITRYAPDALTQTLLDRGFEGVTHCEPSELATTYYKELAPPLRPLGAWRVVHAVGPSEPSPQRRLDVGPARPIGSAARDR